MSLGFKTDRERSEWAELLKHNPKLFAVVEDLVAYVLTMLKKDVVLTSIYRTPEEQAALYAQSARKVTNSQHSLWGAVDLRSSLYTADEIRGIQNYLAAQHPSVYVLYHAIPGNVPHFHLQLPASPPTS